jgi:hypothetical protein
MKTRFAILSAVIMFCGCVAQPQPVQKKLEFTPLDWLPEAAEDAPYSYSFCRPDTARSGATCGGLAGTSTDPYGGTPPYSFSVQFGAGFLPPGLGLELNGLLRGTPPLAGDYKFGICAKDLKGEICKNTSLTVKPKQAVPEETTTTLAQETTTSSTLVQDMFDVKIGSYTCQWTVKTGTYGVKSDCVRLVAKGTAQGPAGASVELPILGWSDDKYDCGVWTTKGNSCVRAAGQPETTAWSVDTEGNECPEKAYFKNARTYTVKIYGDDLLKKEDKKDTTCQ